MSDDATPAKVRLTDWLGASLECEDCHAPAGTVCNDMDCPGKRKTSGRLEHVPFKNCWCEPTAEYVDPETGATVWLHKEFQ